MFQDHCQESVIRVKLSVRVGVVVNVRDQDLGLVSIVSVRFQWSGSESRDTVSDRL